VPARGDKGRAPGRDRPAYSESGHSFRFTSKTAVLLDMWQKNNTNFPANLRAFALIQQINRGILPCRMLPSEEGEADTYPLRECGERYFIATVRRITHLILRTNKAGGGVTCVSNYYAA
jgi:hypothetical protein